MTKTEKRELLEFLISEAKKLKFKIEQVELYYGRRIKENPDDPRSEDMKRSLKKMNDRLANYDRFIKKLSKEQRA